LPYNHETDVPKYGVGSVEFPATIFERPALSLTNLASGRVGAAGRSLFAPDTLTPTEASPPGWKQELLGKNPNRLLKTIVDVATNPLVVAGLVVGYMVYPLGTTKTLAKLAEGIGPQAKYMNGVTHYASGALNGLRSVGGLVGKKWRGLYSVYNDVLMEISGAKAKYIGQIDDVLDKFIAKNGELSSDEMRTVGMFLDNARGGKRLVRRGLDVSKAGVAKNPAMHKYLTEQGYQKGDVLIRGLPDTPRGKVLQGLSDQIRKIQDDFYAQFPQKGEKGFEKLRNRAGLKGETGIFEPDYGLPHYATTDRYTYQALVQRLNRANYSNFIKETEGTLSSNFYQDKAASIVAENAVLATERAGFQAPGLAEAMAKDFAHHARNASDSIKGIWELAKIKGGADDIAVAQNFIDDSLEFFTKGAGKDSSLGARIKVVMDDAALVSKKLTKKQLAQRLGKGPTVHREILNNMAIALQKAEKTGSLKHIQAEFNAMGRVIGSPARYDTHVIETATRYINQGASNLPFFGKGEHSGHIFNKVYEAAMKGGIPGKAPLPPHTRNYIENALMPHLKGYKTWQQMQRTSIVNRWKHGLYDFTKRHLPESSQKKWLMDYFSDLPGSMSAEKLEHGISGRAYTGALGMNPAPVTKNSLQSLATVINLPGMGVGALWKGGKEVAKRLAGGSVMLWDDAAEKGAGAFKSVEMKPFFNNLGKKVKHPLTGKPVSNWEAHFPEYVKMFGEGDDIGKAMARGDVLFEGAATTRHTMGSIKGKSDWVKDKFLWLFGKSETVNRISGFYSGQQQHLFHESIKTGKKITNSMMAEANVVGRNVVAVAHFPGGPLGMPAGTINIPAPLKQFTHFPLRMIDFLAGSLHVGDPSTLLPSLNRLGNWGTIGRATATAGITYEVGKNMLGVDLTGALGPSTLPLPAYEGAPFYPFPLVSPMVGVAGTLAKAALTGDTSKLGASAALFIPGGLAARRAYKTLAPKYADYKNRTEDGRIPVYNEQHSLIGTYTPMQLTLRTMGIKPQTVAQEQGAAKWILSQRDKIRGLRRDYMQALYRNDGAKAQRIQAEFKRGYPELGPMTVKKSDITALKNRRQISRLNRILKGVPKDYRPLFQQAISEASLGNMTRDIEMSPSAIDIYFPQ